MMRKQIPVRTGVLKLSEKSQGFKCIDVEPQKNEFSLTIADHGTIE
jgi:hypothetical protein